jgi:hypothetical protein
MRKLRISGFTSPLEKHGSGGTCSIQRLAETDVASTDASGFSIRNAAFSIATIAGKK